MLNTIKNLFTSKITNLKFNQSIALMSLAIVFTLFLVFGLAIAIEIFFFSKGVVIGLIGNICICILVITYIIVYIKIYEFKSKGNKNS